ncbi:nucleoside triphosphate pyrophosphohydrolase [Streptomyces caniscabiei]|uniref:nucleoside triphosphate pyrophosphohydrolase n=1 Tax=Streptomyces caniscabiei TaxID=2746961 RepID=UPI0029ACB4B3|nr:nucleoside triphosphate pyrophosphohydrolase [Streptomyces caniscabiei]MDX2776267.1 nucleoside triphosphate pyrophosphohydrolase [Streptomyces caniscabiei]
MPIHNKLVRDAIPEIIEKNGQKATVRVLTKEEYTKELLRKLVEEARELLASNGDLDERADVEEVLAALDDTFGWTEKDIRDARVKKNAARGAFTRRLYLEEVR